MKVVLFSLMISFTYAGNPAAILPNMMYNALTVSSTFKTEGFLYVLLVFSVMMAIMLLFVECTRPGNQKKDKSCCTERDEPQRMCKYTRGLCQAIPG